MLKAGRFIFCTWLVALVAFLISACGSGTSEPIGQRDAEFGVSNVAADDPAMNDAIARAQASLGEFAVALQAPGDERSDFSVKVRLEDEENVEHVLLSEPFVTDTQAGGVIANDVLYVEGYSFGDRVTFDLDHVSDWMYVENGVLQGGFTIRVLRDQMSVAEREEFDASLPFVIE
jgi:uncharacterized protein YegJ (DUF2314 family)